MLEDLDYNDGDVSKMYRMEHKTTRFRKRFLKLAVVYILLNTLAYTLQYWFELSLQNNVQAAETSSKTSQSAAAIGDHSPETLNKVFVYLCASLFVFTFICCGCVGLNWFFHVKQREVEAMVFGDRSAD